MMMMMRTMFCGERQSGLSSSARPLPTPRLSVRAPPAHLSVISPPSSSLQPGTLPTLGTLGTQGTQGTQGTVPPGGQIRKLSLPMPVHENSANSPAQHDLKEERVAGRMLRITRGILSGLIPSANISNLVNTLGLSKFQEPPAVGEGRVMMMGLKTYLMIKRATLSHLMINLPPLLLTLDLSIIIPGPAKSSPSRQSLARKVQ